MARGLVVLAEQDRLATSAQKCGEEAQDGPSGRFEYLCGDLSSDTSLVASTTYIMSCQVFVLDGVTLTIERGTTIYAMPVGSPASEAPALVVEQGGRLMAEGTAADPITFTAFNPEETDDSTVVTDTGASVVDTVLETLFPDITEPREEAVLALFSRVVESTAELIAR